ncbi:MAG: class I SAM-dependent methyltransferase [Rhodocyclaceae bacterium]|nr:class I SAM-dependent methyltransferase [Rhodocyclaceae bacterium]MCA3074228.1 class I SAM-dependent methyltransferase [Rhodocyclaceae bacterium]MCA3090913.1 class I SAM-dependent methyltransferase [Rhodocyclaceae bacterium]MCA3095051.1 class I SAM-dependent methyltransferase [Rhodocyclaceae bacterium]MCA3099394.1 class I SAM-dependent methyltransferase [Rhodocyclaceae bacterium]
MASVSGAVSRALLLPAVLPALLPTRAIAQQRFDVPYVPTRQLVVDEMLRLAAVDGNDFLIDLGSGDGRIVVTAARAFGIRGIGFDIDPQRIAEARVNARTAGVQKLVEFREENIFAADFSKATVVTMYLLTAVNLRLRPKLLAELKPGTRVVSHDFHMDDWEPDRRLVVGKTLYLWIIPARVEGKWRVDAGDRRFDLALRQRFQKLEGSATIGSRTARLWEGRLDGERIGFTLTYVPGGDASPIEHDDAERAHRFEGRVEGDTIAGLVTVGIGKSRRQMPFTAMRG